MQGDAGVIELLNEVLTNELTAVNQYYLHGAMQKNWGFTKLGEHTYAESIDEIRMNGAHLAAGAAPAVPFLLAGQMAAADPGRAPEGAESLWLYTHVPHHTTHDAGDGSISGRWDRDDVERMADRQRDDHPLLAQHDAPHARILVADAPEPDVDAPFLQRLDLVHRRWRAAVCVGQRIDRGGQQRLGELGWGTVVEDNSGPVVQLVLHRQKMVGRKSERRRPWEGSRAGGRSCSRCCRAAMVSGGR